MCEDSNWSDYLVTPPNMGTPPDPIPNFNGSSIIPNDIILLDQNDISDIFSQPKQFPTMKPSSLPHDNYSVSHNSFNGDEPESRSIIVGNLNPETTIDQINDLATRMYEVKNIDISHLLDGQITIDYFDIRHAQEMKRRLNGITFNGKVLNVTYAPLSKIINPNDPPNNGTIVIFHLPSNITNTQIFSIFSRFGEIRQIRSTPSKFTQKFVEYWDTRDSEKALIAMHGNYVMGQKVSIEFSLPGGFRRNELVSAVQKVEMPNSSNCNLKIVKPKHD